MGHLGTRSDLIYQVLADRLDEHPFGANVGPALLELLKKLYTASEAELGSRFPLSPVSAGELAKRVERSEDTVIEMLSRMANKGLVYDIPYQGDVYYTLAAPVLGFFEWTFMRMERPDWNEMTGLFNAYFQNPAVEKKYGERTTTIVRTLAYERVLRMSVETEVLDYDRATALIKAAGGGSLQTCSCRHIAMHNGSTCLAGDPMEDICSAMGRTAEYLIRHGCGREASERELLDNLDRAQELKLVVLCDNLLGSPEMICYCCRCCCGVLQGHRMGASGLVRSSNFLPEVRSEKCIGCRQCHESCPVDAVTMIETDSGSVSTIDHNICIGCGICAAVCNPDAISMAARPVRAVPPKNRKEQLLAMNRETGRSTDELEKTPPGLFLL